VAGGHSIVDQEPKYGLAVIGRADPDKILTLSGAQSGDVLLLSKPLGTGVVTTALKEGAADPDDVAFAVESMAALNSTAATIALAAGATAATDVTGFSLAGHALEMADHSGVGLRLEAGRLPLLPGARSYAERGFVPGGSVRNRATYAPRVAGLEHLDEGLAVLVFDAQTSGGLLIALPVDSGPLVMDQLAASGIDARLIGEVVDGSGLELC
jgi:selenide,water dikinase